MLAALAASPGEPVSSADLIDWIWDGDPPTTAVSVLYSQIARTRTWLRGHSAEIQRSTGGYVLDTDPDEIDLHRARNLAARAGIARDPVHLWREATALAQGEALAGVKGRWAEDFRDAIHRERTGWRAARFQAELAAGHHAAVVDELAAAAQAEPLAEPIAAAFMLALYRCGRPAEALVVFDDLRRRLRDELGADPATELRELHRRILDHDPVLTAAQPSAPFQLPATIGTFVGRDRELSILDGIPPDEHGTGLVTIVGPAGVGKTTLAVRWAHRARERFSDGQLYLNLRGFDPGGQVMSPGTALLTLLELLGVPPAKLPSTVEAQAGLFRGRLAQTKMLLLLDNARDAEQIRLLLPGSPGNLVLVTSRDQLTGLVTAEGARPLRLDLLDDAEARQLLAHRLGQRRVQAEPAPVDQIIAVCGGLPLALAIVAARAITDPGVPLAAFATELADVRGRLNAFAGPDPATDVRAVFSWSYHALRPSAARLFRLLGLHSGPHIGVDAAASLAGLATAQVTSLLADLAGAHLLAEHAPGRYAFHDLVAAYAAELTESSDAQAERESGLRRLLDYYVHTAHAANRLLFPSRNPIRLALSDPDPNASFTHLTDYQQAMDWCTAEHQVLLAVLPLAFNAGHYQQAWQLAWSLDTFLSRGSYWQQQVEAWQWALNAADRLNNLTAQAYAHRALASTLTNLRQYDDALHHLRRGLELSVQTGNQTDQANMHRIFGFVHWRQGNPREALAHALEALALFQSAGERERVVGMLNNIGACYAQLDDHTRDIEYCEQALTMLRQIGDQEQEAHTWDSLAYSHHHLGHHDQAVDCYEHAIALFRQFGDAYNEARSLSQLGDTHAAAQDDESAVKTWRAALEILDDINHPDANDLRAKLAEAR